MQNLAVLLTCFNRKEKTINCLKALYQAYDSIDDNLVLTIYITDDGSTDGTSDAVKKEFPETIILKGTGTMYWNGGMRNTWKAAIGKGHDAYLLLNDDTILFKNALQKLLESQAHCKEKHLQDGICIGSTQDPKTNEFTYGGRRLTHKFKFTSEALPPNGEYQICELGNANIMLVPNEVVKKIGILYGGYRHGIGDIDYTLKAQRKGIPSLVLPDYLGYCEHDHRDFYNDFPEKSFFERWKSINHPLGLDLSSNLLFMWRHFPLRLPFVTLSAFYKLFFPSNYVKVLRANR